MQPDANIHMANALLVAHQYHIDYAQGATDYFNKSWDATTNANNPQPYQRLSKYDQSFIGTMRPEVYVSAISALNGKPYSQWADGLTPKQLQLVGGILQRADPNAQVDVGGQRRSVMDFKTVTSPADIMP
jgi:hypothetical protein